MGTYLGDFAYKIFNSVVRKLVFKEKLQIFLDRELG